MSTMESAKSADATVTVEFWVFENTGLGPVIVPVSATSSLADLRELVNTPRICVQFTRAWGWRDLSGVAWLKPENCKLSIADWDAPLSAFLPKPSAAADADAPPPNTVTIILKPPTAPIAAGSAAPGDEQMERLAGLIAAKLSSRFVGHIVCDKPFSEASNTTVEVTLENMTLVRLPSEPPVVPDAVFTPYTWTREPIRFKPEPEETEALMKLGQNLLHRAGVAGLLVDVSNEPDLQVKFDHHTKRNGREVVELHRHHGKLDAVLVDALYDGGSPYTRALGGIEYKTPAAFPVEAFDAKSTHNQTALKTIALWVRSRRDGIPVLVTDFSTRALVLCVKGSKLNDYRTKVDEKAKSKQTKKTAKTAAEDVDESSDVLAWAELSPAHAWSVWVHLVKESRIEFQRYVVKLEAQVPSFAEFPGGDFDVAAATDEEAAAGAGSLRERGSRVGPLDPIDNLDNKCASPTDEHFHYEGLRADENVSMELIKEHMEQQMIERLFRRLRW